MADKYVDAYLRLEDRAAGAESKADEYRKRADDNRWEQCRIAHEATSDGGYSKSAFADNVGVSRTTIQRQVKIWERWGCTVTVHRPTYAEAIAWSLGSTAEAETDRKQLANAKTVARNPEAVRELLRDPVAAAVVANAVDEKRRADVYKPVVKQAPKGDEAFLDCMNQMLRVEAALNRLVENLNEGRKNGFLTPAVIREFVAKLRLYADALDSIASSRGLTDEALAEWIGAE